MGRVATTLAWATSMMLRLNEHQLATSTYRPSGVTATYFGTRPTWMTWSMVRVATSTRYTELSVSPARGGGRGGGGGGSGPRGAGAGAVHRVVRHVGVGGVGREGRLDRRSPGGARAAGDPEAGEVARVGDRGHQAAGARVHGHGVAVHHVLGEHQAGVGGVDRLG